MQLNLEEIMKIFPVAFPASDFSLFDMVNTLQGSEPLEEASFFYKKKWTEIHCDILSNHSSAFYFFSPAFYLYYLPSVIAGSLVDFDATFDSTSIIVFDMARCRDDLDKSIWDKTYGFLDEESCDFLILWMREMMDYFSKYGYEDDVLRAIEILGSEPRCRRFTHGKNS